MIEIREAVPGSVDRAIARLGTLADGWAEAAQARARKVADAARAGQRSSRIAASVEVRERADGAEVVIGAGVPFTKAHAAGYRLPGSTISRAGKIAYRKLRPKRER